MTASMRFLGAAGTVTGSRHLVSTPDGSILVEGFAVVPRHGEEVALA